LSKVFGLMAAALAFPEFRLVKKQGKPRITYVNR
jgi:hypothetical protein